MKRLLACLSIVFFGGFLHADLSDSRPQLFITTQTLQTATTNSSNVTITSITVTSNSNVVSTFTQVYPGTQAIPISSTQTLQTNILGVPSMSIASSTATVWTAISTSAVVVGPGGGSVPVISTGSVATGPGGGSVNVVSTGTAVFASTAVITDTQQFFTVSAATTSISSSTASGESNTILSTTTGRMVGVVVNEGPFDIRVGASKSNITQAIGLLLKSGASLNLDMPRYFRGALFGVSVGTSSSKVSTLEGSQ